MNSKPLSFEDLKYWQDYVWNPGVIGYLDDYDLENYHASMFLSREELRGF